LEFRAGRRPGKPPVGLLPLDVVPDGCGGRCAIAEPGTIKLSMMKTRISCALILFTTNL